MLPAPEAQEEAVTAQDLSQKFSSVKGTFAHRWREGTGPWLDQQRPDLAVAMAVTQADLDSTWKAVLEGRGPIVTFEIALMHWGLAHVAALDAWERK